MRPAAASSRACSATSKTTFTHNAGQAALWVRTPHIGMAGPGTATRWGLSLPELPGHAGRPVQTATRRSAAQSLGTNALRRTTASQRAKPRAVQMPRTCQTLMATRGHVVRSGSVLRQSGSGCHSNVLAAGKRALIQNAAKGRASNASKKTIGGGLASLRARNTITDGLAKRSGCAHQPGLRVVGCSHLGP